VHQFWKININDTTYKTKIGRLFGGEKLMLSLGFCLEDNGNVIALRDPNGISWQTVPHDVRKSLMHRLDELRSHRQALDEPSISNVAAVSHAIGKLGSDHESINHWITAIETILVLLTNIIKHPHVETFYTINVMNPNFVRRVSKMEGALNMLISLGFRELSSGEVQMPLEASLVELEARRLEYEVGLQILKARAKFYQSGVKADKSKIIKKAAATSGKNTKELPKENSSESINKSKDSKNVKIHSEKDDVDYEKYHKKSESALKEEKEKRTKAEVALIAQTSLVQTLQSQLSDMQERDHKNLTIRQSMTISRLEEKEKKQMKKQVDKLNKSSFGFEHEQDEPKTKAKSDKVSAKSKTISKTAALKSGDQEWMAATTLKDEAPAGSTTLNTKSNDGFKKGLKILIGTGTHVEVRTVVALGSLIIDTPTTFKHPPGTIIKAYPTSVKGSHSLHHAFAEEFVSGFMMDELIPSICEEGHQRALENHLNAAYEERPVLQHSYHLIEQPHNYISGNVNKLVGQASKSCVLGVHEVKGSGATSLLTLPLI
jgi:hypothetical protein